jgi:hypothetical protein
VILCSGSIFCLSCASASCASAFESTLHKFPSHPPGAQGCHEVVPQVGGIYRPSTAPKIFPIPNLPTPRFFRFLFHRCYTHTVCRCKKLNVDNMKLLALTMGISGFLLNLLGASNVQYEIRAEDAIENEKQQLTKSTRTLFPVVINTWAFTNATQRGNFNLR